MAPWQIKNPFDIALKVRSRQENRLKVFICNDTSSSLVCFLIQINPYMARRPTQCHLPPTSRNAPLYHPHKWVYIIISVNCLNTTTWICDNRNIVITVLFNICQWINYCQQLSRIVRCKSLYSFGNALIIPEVDIPYSIICFLSISVNTGWISMTLNMFNE